MPAPENLTTNTPGEPLGTITPLASTVSSSTGAGGTSNAGDTNATQAQAPEFTAKHNGGGRWKIWKTEADGGADWFSDFVGAKEAAIAEAQRLTDGGEPLKLDPERKEDRAAQAQARPSATEIDPTTIKQAVMTPDGWLCPEPPVKE